METIRQDVGAIGSDRPAERRSLVYLPALDGLRAVSVLAVVAFHAAPDRVPGGFLGVDVFFVISGFLITSLLLREHRKERRVSLRAFWRRRARRLGPALLTVLTATAIAGWLWTPATELGRLRGDGLATLGYVMNWRLVVTDDSYFDTFAGESPLRHLWSLAVEEQFYLLWPIVLVAVLARRRGLLGPVAALIGAASVAAMAALGDDVSRVYYGTDTHVHVIMVGVVLAVLADRRPAFVRLLAPTPLVPVVTTGVLVAAMAVVDGGDPGFYPWGLLLFSLGSAVVVSGCARYGDLPLLSHHWLVEIGRRSYGLYLWHWPVEVFLTDDRLGLGPVAATVARLAVSFGATWLSFRLIEQPVRRSHAPLPRWWPVLPLAVAGLFVVTTLGATDSGFAAGTDDGQLLQAAPTTDADPSQPDPTQPDGPGSVTFGSVLVLGDSVAQSLGQDLVDAFAARGAEASLLPHIGCGVADGLVIGRRGTTPEFARDCPEHLARQDELIAELDPELVLVIAHVDSFPRRFGDGGELDPLDDLDGTVALLERAADRLAADGAVVAFALPADVTVDDDPDTNRRIAVYRRAVERLADERDDVVAVDVSGVVCPDDACRAEIEGVELRPDGVHYSDESAPLIAPELVDATVDAVVAA